MMRPLALVSLFLALLLSALPVSAHEGRWVDGGVWVHQHTREYAVFIDVSRHLRKPVRAAMREWDRETTARLHEVSRPFPGVDIIVRDVWSTDSFQGSTSVPYFASGHYDVAAITLNLRFLGHPAPPGGPRSVACHEFGHALGLEHFSARDSHDCMQNGAYNRSTKHVGHHSIRWVNALVPLFRHSETIQL